ncbi:MAG TPA: TetR/AcrR family transcriptional regulator [Candidatus Binataceae bacterium]|nr:TetR/AcrR family transcriptional regulator [Candidatus Binataceae bacterium]
MLTPARRSANSAAAAPRKRGTLDQVLVDAAMDLFASYGYRGTSLARIARAAGVTKGALYWHFTDKEDFFLAVVDKVLREWNTAFARKPGTTAEEFRAEFLSIFETNAALNQKNPWVSRLLLIITLESHKIGPRVLRAMRKANTDQLAHLRLVVERGKELGVFKPTLDVQWAGTQMWSASIGLALLWYLHGTRFKFHDSSKRQAREFLEDWSAA